MQVTIAQLGRQGVRVQAVRRRLPVYLYRVRRVSRHSEPAQQSGALLQLRPKLQQHRLADDARLRLPLGRRSARTVVKEPPRTSHIQRLAGQVGRANSSSKLLAPIF